MTEKWKLKVNQKRTSFYKDIYNSPSNAPYKKGGDEADSLRLIMVLCCSIAVFCDDEATVFPTTPLETFVRLFLLTGVSEYCS